MVEALLKAPDAGVAREVKGFRVRVVGFGVQGSGFGAGLLRS